MKMPEPVGAAGRKVESDSASAASASVASVRDDGAPPLVAVRNRWHELRFSNASRSQAKANARFHYALGTAFYRLFGQ